MAGDERRAEVEAAVSERRWVKARLLSAGFDAAEVETMATALDRLRDARGDDEADKLEDDVRYERDRAERLEEQLAEARAMRDHNQRVADEAQQRADDLADRLEMAARPPLEAARSPQGEDHEERTDQDRKRDHWSVERPQVARFTTGGDWRCPDERCGEGRISLLVPHPDDPQKVPNRCPMCLTTAVRRSPQGEGHEGREGG